MRVETIIPPAVMPVLLSEVKDHLRIDHTVEDAYLTGLIQAAVSTAEAYCDIAVIDRTVDIYMNRWPSLHTSRWWDGVHEGSITDVLPALKHIKLPVSPVSEIVSLSVFAADDTETVIDTVLYQLSPGQQPQVGLSQGISLYQPKRAVDGIRLRVIAGYGPDWNAVPAAIRQALLMLVAHLYAYRGDGAATAMKSCGAQAMLAPYKKVKL